MGLQQPLKLSETVALPGFEKDQHIGNLKHPGRPQLTFVSTQTFRLSVPTGWSKNAKYGQNLAYEKLQFRN